VTAVLDAVDGKRDTAATSLARSVSPIARGDAGILFWQLGMGSDAKPHLGAARKAFADWSEVSLAAAEVAIGERRYDDAAQLLDAVSCNIVWGRRAGSVLEITLGTDTDVCGRAKKSLSIALLDQAADELDRAAKRQDE